MVMIVKVMLMVMEVMVVMVNLYFVQELFPYAYSITILEKLAVYLPLPMDHL